MADERLTIWEALFQKALLVIDFVRKAGIVLSDWSFGGGTVLMRRHWHRFSKDIDIFIPDPQYLNYLSPHLNEAAESLTGDYTLQANFLKLQFPEGEIDFVVSAPLTQNPTVVENLFDRRVQVETSAEIVAKKIWHRGDRFRARDIFDLSLVAEREPTALREIAPVLRERRDAVTEWITSREPALRDDFGNLEILEYKRSFDECVRVVRHVFESA